MKVFWMCVLWFCLGFVAQYSFVKISLFEKNIDAYECTQSSDKYSDIITCFVARQSTFWTRLVNWVNPADMVGNKWIFVLNKYVECIYGSIEENNGGIDESI